MKKSIVDNLTATLLANPKKLEELNKKDLINVSGGISTKQFMIGISLLSLILLGAGSLNNLTVHAAVPQDTDSQATNISSFSEKDHSSHRETNTGSRRKTKTIKITKPLFKNTARGRLYLQKQKREDRFTRTFLEEPKYASQELLDFLMVELKPLNQEAEKLAVEKKEEMEKRAAEKRENKSQSQREYRAKLTSEQREDVKQTQREYCHREEVKQHRREIYAEKKDEINRRRREKRAQLTPEAREKIRERGRERIRQYYANLTPEQKEARKTTLREYRAARKQGTASQATNISRPFEEEFDYSTPELLSYLMGELDQEAEKRAEEKKEEMEKRAAEEREKINQHRREIYAERKDEINRRRREKRAQLTTPQREKLHKKERERLRQYYAKNKEAIKQRAKARRASLSAEQKEVIKQRAKARRANLSPKQKETIKQYMRLYHATLPSYKKEEYRQRQRERRAAQKQSQATSCQQDPVCLQNPPQEAPVDYSSGEVD